MKVAVVGAGIMGLAAAWALRRRGHDVTVFDQGPVPNPAGASFDQHRLIRHPYGAQVGYMKMVSDAYLAWDALWDDLGESFYVPTGTLVLDTTQEGWAAESAEALEAFGIAFERIEPRDLERVFPLLDGRGVASAFFVSTGGVLLASRIVEALVHHVVGRGVRIEPETRVVALEAEAGRLALDGGRSAAADAVVVAAGAWAPRLLPALAERVTPSRQVVAYVEPPPDRAAAWTEAPMILDIDAGFYLVPPVAGTGLKIGDHSFTRAGNPDDERVAREAEARVVFGLCRGRLRDYERYRLASAKVCFYTVESNERFVVERTGRTWVVSACSGHGFKFGAVLGQRVAAAIDEDDDPETLARWAAGRP